MNYLIIIVVIFKVTLPISNINSCERNVRKKNNGFFFIFITLTRKQNLVALWQYLPLDKKMTNILLNQISNS